MYQDISVERKDNGVGVIQIDRPDRNNAVRAETFESVCAVLDEFTDDDSIRAIVFGARGRHFIPGADLAFLEALKSATAAHVQNNIYKLFQGATRRLYNCPKPTIAAVQGAAVTVGCEIAISCDFRIVSERAMFQESWIKLGLMPPLGGTFLLPRMVGTARASEMVLQARAIKAEEAVEIGLANELVAEDRLMERALELASELASLPPQAYRTVKDALHRGYESTMEREWAANVVAQSVLIKSEDFEEGVAAAMEKRPGNFTGR